MTEQAILNKLKAGNEQFLTTSHAIGDVSVERRLTTSSGQQPYAVVLTCADSRIAPEAIFSVSLGELFVIRVAGNVVGDSELASIDFAVNSLGCEVLLVLGHTHCGAIKAAMAPAQEGPIETILQEIREVIHDEKDDVHASCLNVRHSMKKVEAQLRPKGKLSIVGGIYDIETGKVDFISGIEPCDVCAK